MFWGAYPQDKSFKMDSNIPIKLIGVPALQTLYDRLMKSLTQKRTYDKGARKWGDEYDHEMDGEEEEIGGGGSEPPTSSGSVESCLRVVAQPIRPLFSLYNPSFPPFPAHIRGGALS